MLVEVVLELCLKSWLSYASGSTAPVRSGRAHGDPGQEAARPLILAL